MIKSARPYFDDEQIQFIQPKIEQVLRSGRLILGKETEAFEQQYAQWIGTKHAIAVSSGSAALEIVFRYLYTQLEYGKRTVVMPTQTFIASALAPMRAGFEVRVVPYLDADDFREQEDYFRPLDSIGVMMAIHLAGFVHEQIQELREICQDNETYLVEDASHAHGARSNLGFMAGDLGFAGCFSLYPTKVLTSGGGGMITTMDSNLDDFARIARHHGGAPPNDYVALTEGSNWTMSEVQAVLGQAQMLKIEETLAHRRAMAAAYAKNLDEDDRIRLPYDGGSPSYYKYPVILNGITRDQIRPYMANSGVEIGALYEPPLHRQPILQNLIFVSESPMFERQDEFLSRQVCLPMHALLSESDVYAVCRTLKRAMDLAE